MKTTKRRVLYVLAALLAVLFVLSCLVGFAACGGGEDEPHTHTWDAGVVTKQADCGNAGETTYTCTECGETKTETIPATGNHTWDEGTVTKEATTEAEGEITYTCTVCGATKTDKIDKLESSGGNDDDNPGTGDNPSGGDENPDTGDEPGEGGGSTGGDENPDEGNDDDDDDETEPMQVATADALVEALEEGGEIELTADIAASSSLTVSAETTLDLAGYTLTGTGDDTITVASTGSLTVEDTTETGKVDAKTNGKAALVNEGGTVVLNGGTFERSQEAGMSEGSNGGNSYYTVVNHGTMTINEGVSILNAGDCSSNLENGWYSGGDETMTATLTVNGGTICGGLYAVKNDSCGTLVVNGGTIGGARSETDTMPYRALLNWNVATLNGGKLLGGNSGEPYESGGSQYYADGSVIYNTASSNSFECGKLTIGKADGSGPEIVYEVSSNDNKTGAGYADAIYLYGGDVTVQGGSIGFDIDEGEEEYCDCTGVWVIDGTLTVTGGSISGDEAIYVYGGNGSVLITGGTFTGTIENYLSAEDVVIVAADETMLDWAVALDDVTAILGSNIAVSDTVTISTTIILDLAGYTLSCDSNHTITVTAIGDLTVIDSSNDATGTVDVTAAGSAALFNEGTVTLKGGTFTRSSEVSVDDSATNSWYTVVNHGTMTIEEGTTIFNAGGSASNLENGWASGGTEGYSATLTINGGTICGGLYAIKNDSCGTLTINGGTIGGARSEEDTAAYSALLNWNVATINGGTLLGGNGGYAVYNCASTASYESGKLTINGGTITTTDESEDMVIGVYAKAGTVTISGGTITASEGDDCVGIYVEDCTVTISDGTISGDESVFVYGDPKTGTVSISGGTFTGAISAWEVNNQNPVTITDEVISSNGFTLTTTSSTDWGNHYVYTPNSSTEPDDEP